MYVCISFIVESVVPYSPLSCISDHATAPSPCVQPRTPDCFAGPSFGQVSSVNTPESVISSAVSAHQPASLKLQKDISTSSVNRPPSESNVSIKGSPLIQSSQSTACADDVVTTDDNSDKKVATEHSRLANCASLDLLPFSMMNVFNSEEQKNQVIADVSRL